MPPPTGATKKKKTAAAAAKGAKRKPPVRVKPSPASEAVLEMQKALKGACKRGFAPAIVPRPFSALAGAAGDGLAAVGTTDDQRARAQAWLQAGCRRARTALGLGDEEVLVQLDTELDVDMRTFRVTAARVSAYASVLLCLLFLLFSPAWPSFPCGNDACNIVRRFPYSSLLILWKGQRGA